MALAARRASCPSYTTSLDSNQPCSRELLASAPFAVSRHICELWQSPQSFVQGCFNVAGSVATRERREPGAQQARRLRVSPVEPHTSGGGEVHVVHVIVVRSHGHDQ